MLGPRAWTIPRAWQRLPPLLIGWTSDSVAFATTPNALVGSHSCSVLARGTIPRALQRLPAALIGWTSGLAGFATTPNALAMALVHAEKSAPGDPKGT
jgi:hypothetical protein